MTSETCNHTRSHIVDSRFHGHSYSTPESRSIFCDTCRLRRWLRIEAVLASAQAALGLIPESAAQEICQAASSSAINFDNVARGIRETGHSIVPLLQELQATCSPASREFIHFGATSQDIQDTSQALEMRDVLDQASVGLESIAQYLRGLTVQHRDSLMIARTHAVAALPTTFGFKVAGWLDELQRNRTRLGEVRVRVLVAQLFGGVGTMAALGDRALELLEAFATSLGLTAPAIGWHVSRDRVTEFVSTMAMLTTSLARIADEVRTLSRAEFGELELTAPRTYVGSSTMPHKQNPECCEQVVVLARLCKAQVGIAFDAMILDHERDYRGTRLEWCAVADVSHYTLAALHTLLGISERLKVNSERMLERAMESRDAICAERIVFAMASSMGKESAYQVVTELRRKSHEIERPLSELLRTDEKVIEALGGAEAVERALDPHLHLGQHSALIQRVLEPGT